MFRAKKGFATAIRQACSIKLKKVAKKGLTPRGASAKLAAHTETIPIKMRTKALILSAFVGALGFTAAQAQVYSVNAVGYVNKSIPAGFSIVANPLNNGENMVADVFGANPGALTVYRFGDAGFAINSYDADFEEWENGDI